MKLLVTGALGHIGSRFIRTLSADRFDEVILLDNLLTQRYPSLFNLPSDIVFRFIDKDILTTNLEGYLQKGDVVIHLAAITNAEASIGNAEQVEQTNLEGTELVARACAAKESSLIFLSTTSVYGVQDSEVDENCTIDQLQPQSPYADSKLKAERMLARLGEEEGLRFVTCRFGTIFGPSHGMRFHTAVNKFIWQACTGQPLTVWSSALDQQRPYLDLEDAVRALDYIVMNNIFDCSIYNVLTINATVRQIVDAIRAFVPDVEISLVDSQIMNQLSYTVSNRKFSAHGFQFTGNLQERIAETVSLLRGVRHW